MNGDKTLPPIRLSMIREGPRLFLTCFKYWLPAFVAIIFASVSVATLPQPIADILLGLSLILVSAPVATALLSGNIVGIARYAAVGDRSLICQRWENTRLALTNFIDTAVFSSALFVLFVVSVAAISQIAILIIQLRVSDLLAEAALASFVFFFTVLCVCIFSSHLLALYARWIGICDNFNHSSRHG